jgi:hypothetical protein
MAGIVGILKKKQKPIVNSDAPKHNPYTMASEFPEEEDRLFDSELKLLLMDGLALLQHKLGHEITVANFFLHNKFCFHSRC